MNFVQKLQHRVYVSKNYANFIYCQPLPKSSTFITKPQNHSNSDSPTLNAQINQKKRSVQNGGFYISERQNFSQKTYHLSFGNEERKSFEY